VNARVAAVVLAAGVVVDAGRAYACSIAGDAPHTIDATRQDRVPPEPPTDVSILVNRSSPEEGGGCGSSDSTSSSCDGLATVQLLLNEPATDDQTARENMGYLIKVVDGTPPSGISLQNIAMRGRTGTTLTLDWFDDDTEAQEVVAFSVTLTPVDEAGNEGSASDPIRIYDPGSSEGCATPRRAPSLDAALLFMLVAALVRASRRRRVK
jgi:hypothetical protein